MTEKNIGNLFQLLIKAVESSANGIIITNSDGVILWVNPAIENLTGYTSSEMIGRTPRILKSGKQTPEVYQNLWKTIKSGQIWKGEFINRKKDGSLYTDEQTITPVKNDKGEITNFISVRQDITEKREHMKKIETQNKLLQNTQTTMLNLMEDEKILKEELQKEKENIEKTVEERTMELKEKSVALKLANDEVSRGWHAIQKEKAILAASISSLPLGFIITDPHLDILTINDTAKKLLKLDAEVPNLADIDRIFSININLLKLIETAKRNLETIEIKEAMFGNKYIHISLVPILSAVANEKEFLGTVILIGDITERKLMDRARDEFFSIASHELRTPLTAIRGNVKLIDDIYKSRIEDADFHEMLEDIHESSVRLINIVNDFLNTSRLEMGTIEFKKERFSLKELIENVYQELKGNAESKGLAFDLNFPDADPLYVQADQTRTQEVLTNLIGNSIKFTQKGSISIACRGQNGFVETIIKDTGLGIKDKNQNLLFRKFQQAEENIYTRDVTQGTGLGLYISKLLVEKMGGKIKLLKSKENEGSAFSFTLPNSHYAIH